MSRTVVTVNGLTWKQDSHNLEKPCGPCGKPTRGRLDRKPYCIDCGMKQVMQPLADVKEVIRGLFQ